jgi:hypothetical protein
LKKTDKEKKGLNERCIIVILAAVVAVERGRKLLG